MKSEIFAISAHAAIFCAFAGNVLATTIISDASVDYPRLTAFASGGASAQDLSSTDANVDDLTAVSIDGRNPPPKINSAFAGIDRQLGEFGVQSTHTLTVSVETGAGGVSRASVSDQFIIQTDLAVAFHFQALVQASLAPSTGTGREIAFTLSKEGTGEVVYSYNWSYAREVIFQQPNPTLTPSFSTILEPGTYKFEAYAFDQTSFFGQGATTTSFDYSFSVPEPSSAAMLGFAFFSLLMVRRKRGARH